MKILIAGGGIGGVTAALALTHHGFEVCVLEQAAELAETGAGIQISPNGAKVLRALDLLAQVEQIAFRPERIEMRFGKSGGEIFSIPLAAEAVHRWGAPYLHVHRADLLDVLVAELRRRAPHAIRTGAKLARYVAAERQVEAVLETGEVLAGDVLIGADGIRSTVRAQMLGPEAPRFTGCVAWRAVVPMNALSGTLPPPTACVWVGPGKHAVTYRIRRGELANFVGVVERDDWRKESWSEEGTREEALRDFAGYHAAVTNVIEAAPRLFRWALFDREPLSRWTEGRVAMLGDACHPMLPFMAQGAVMAMEDSWVLANRLKTIADPVEALCAYETARISRTARVQAAARANTGIFHRRTGLGKLLTYGPMRLGAALAPNLVHARQDWLYQYDATAA
jgi:salicylate hydroxylase